MNHRALLIGVVRYQNNDLCLDAADRNTERLADLLISHYGFVGREIDIRIRVDPARTTREAIWAEIRDWLMAEAGEGDIRILAVSTHGLSFGGEQGGTNDFLITSDRDPFGKRSGIFQSEIEALIPPATPARVHGVFDSCRPRLPAVELVQLLRTAVERAGLDLRAMGPLIDRAAVRSLEGFAGMLPAARSVIVEDEASPWVLLKACGLDQLAAYNQFGGKFTRTLCDVLQSAACCTPVEALAQVVARNTLSGQDPEARGPATRLRTDAVFS